MSNAPGTQRARGYTLIELSIGISLLGLVLILIWRFGFIANQRIAEAEAPPALAAAEQALMGFVAANNRLPCPDINNDGREDCGVILAGEPCPDLNGDGVADCTGLANRLPVVTLGLARADLAAVRYGVYRSYAASARADADLAAPRDRFWPLLAGGTPVAAVTAPLGHHGGVDFCTALANAGGAARNPGLLAIRDGGGNVVRNVAYALALPGTRDADGDGNPFDGGNTVAASFAAPSATVTGNYDDTVRVADFSQVFERIGCAGMLAAAGHAHPNAASSAAILDTSMGDYHYQLELAAEMAGVKVASATAGVASAAAGVSTAAATMLIAVSQTLVSQGALAGIIAAGAAAVAANAVATAASAATLAVAIAAKVLADQKVTEFQPIRTDASALATELRANAINADRADMFR